MSFGSVFVLDVQQGNSQLIITPTGEVVVVDCHLAAGRARPATVDALEELAKARRLPVDIDVLCITHPDSDHYSGVVELLKWLEAQGGIVKRLILYAPLPRELAAYVSQSRKQLAVAKAQPGARIPVELGRLDRKTRLFMELYQELIKIRGKLEPGRYARASNYLQFVNFESSTVHVIGPTSSRVDQVTERLWRDVVDSWTRKKHSVPSANEVSVILWITIDKCRILLTGDASAEGLIEAMEAYEEQQGRNSDGLRCDVVVAAHHGARTGSSIDFWRKSLSDGGFVAISSGSHRGYGHPHQETIDDIRNSCSGVTIGCTNKCGLVREINETVLSVRVETSFLDGLLEFNLGQNGTVDDTTYQGKLTYIVDEQGAVEFVPEVMPITQCKNHCI
ncbi:MAG: MBL fold metallo-hydrolase [Planctomycetaceae bacterium]|nr:MBL fold metallo-hydrolase [Planctomycetaceae bacterium]